MEECRGLSTAEFTRADDVHRAFHVLDSTSVMVPVIGNVSAEIGVIAAENIKSYMSAPSDLINPYSTYFYLEVQGDNMEPEIMNGDYVLVQGKIPLIQSN